MNFETFGLEEARKYDAGDSSVIAGTQFEERLDRWNRSTPEIPGYASSYVYVVEAFIPGCLNDYVGVFETLEDAIKDRNDIALGWYGPDTHVELRWAGSEDDWTGDLAAKRHEDSQGGYAISISVEDAENWIDADEVLTEFEELTGVTRDEYEGL